MFVIFLYSVLPDWCIKLCVMVVTMITVSYSILSSSAVVAELITFTYIEHDQVTRIQLRASYVYELIVQNTTRVYCVTVM